MFLFLVLRNQLQKAVDNEIPVLMAVAVIGSTEESSVDDVDTILKMRDEFALKVSDSLYCCTTMICLSLMMKFRAIIK